MKKLLLNIIALLLVSQIFSQHKNQTIDMGVYVLGGFSSFNNKELNNFLNEQNFTGFAENIKSINTGMYIGNKEKGFVGFDLSTFNQYTKNELDHYSTLNQIEISASINYTVLNTQKFHIYPYVNTGIEALTLTIINYSGTINSFNSAINNLQGERVFYTGPLVLYKGGISVNYVIKDYGVKILLSSKVGYTGSFTEVEWGSNGFLVPEGPQSKSEGFFLQFGITLF